VIAVTGVVAVALVVWSTVALASDSRETQRKCDEAGRMIRALSPRSDELYVVWREWFPYEALVTPLGDLGPLRPMRCISLSGLLDTPIWERRLAEFGATDLCLAICERPNVRLVAIPPMVDNLLRPYALRHYGFDPALSLCFARNDVAGVPVFVFRPDPRRGSPTTAPAGAPTLPGR
jgi:hypothetical protein